MQSVPFLERTHLPKREHPKDPPPGPSLGTKQPLPGTLPWTLGLGLPLEANPRRAHLWPKACFGWVGIGAEQAASINLGCAVHFYLTDPLENPMSEPDACSSVVLASRSSL